MKATLADQIEYASSVLMQIQTEYASKGFTLCQAALGGSREFIAWKHYPEQDYIDSVSGYEFYYHAHDGFEMPEGEHGHFHLFKRSDRHPKKFMHLIGVALDSKGLPVRLFTTNQWVTGETMAQGKHVILALAGFTIRARGRLAPIAKWLNALLIIYADEIASLIARRDQWISRNIDLGTHKSILLQDRNHHVLSECPINLIEKLSFISKNNRKETSS